MLERLYSEADGHLLNKLSAFDGTNHYCGHYSSPLEPNIMQLNPVNIRIFCFHNIHFNIALTSSPRLLNAFLEDPGFQNKVLYTIIA